MPIIREIFWLCVENDVTVSSCHIPGKLNVLADNISRMDSLSHAKEARIMLAGFSTNVVPCMGHMSKLSFDSLQRSWITASNSYK